MGGGGGGQAGLREKMHGGGKRKSLRADIWLCTAGELVKPVKEKPHKNLSLSSCTKATNSSEEDEI